MKHCFILCLLLSFIVEQGYSQDSTRLHKMFRVYEDNDLFKLLGPATDKGYTNGTQLDFYYIKNHHSKFFMDRWLPKAGADAVNTFGWTLMQVMYTPTDYAALQPDIHDWPYSGGLYLTHSLHSSNPVKTFSYQSEILLGIMGPGSLAGPFQTVIHRAIGNHKPEGWQYQNPTDLLLNVNFTAEKQLWQYKKRVDIAGGAQLMAGTMMDNATMYLQFRFGLMTPYFNGLIQDFVRSFTERNKIKFYLTARPGLDWNAYNAILEGGVFSGQSTYYKDNPNGTAEKENHAITRQLDLGATLAIGSVSFSFNQRLLARAIKGFNHQTVGNLVLNIGFR